NKGASLEGKRERRDVKSEDVIHLPSAPRSLWQSATLNRTPPLVSFPARTGTAMAKLIYAAIASLDGYIEDERGKFDWAEPDEQVHAFINDLERSVGTYLYGRRMYEMMIGWETNQSLAAGSPLMRDFAQIWQSADKIVFSRTLET